jgi:predicted RND superfamily exporter protein
VYLSVFFRQRYLENPSTALAATVRHAGIAIFQTTLIIDLGLVVLSFSSYRAIAQVAILALVTLSCCTAVTYLFVPHLIRFMMKTDQLEEASETS